MATLFNNVYSKSELLRRVGDMSQLAYVRPVELVNGHERGVRALVFHTGSGLQFTVLLDRAMDIYDASFQGCSLCWHSPAGVVAPAFHDPHDIGWLYSMPGGLLISCGLTHVGNAEIDEEVDEELGMHGRIANIPAKNVAFGAEWEEDEYILWASGEIRETSLFGANLLLRRSIHAKLGQSRIWIKDEVMNQGFTAAPLMLLYHCNAGFPLFDDEAELLAVINNLEPHDKESEKGIERFEYFDAPTPEFREHCFFIDHDTDNKNIVNVALVNRRCRQNRGLGLYLAYPKSELPYFTVWKMIGEGTYFGVLAPGNCLPEGRAAARKRGRLTLLPPQQSCAFHLELGVLADNDEIRSFEQRLRGQGWQETEAKSPTSYEG